MERQRSGESGAILVVVLILMMGMTLMGTIALNSATVDTRISGHVKRAAKAFEGAEAGIHLAVPVIENTLARMTLTPAAPDGIILTGMDTGGLESEILGMNGNDPDTVAVSPDLAMDQFNGVAVSVDIDHLYADFVAGGAAGFAMGQDGLGTGSNTGGSAIFYRIDSQGVR